MVPFVLIALVLMIVIALAIYSFYANKKRLDALDRMAQQFGLRFTRGPGGPTLPYEPFQQGENRYAENTLTGSWQDRPVQMGDFHYETHSTDSKGNRTTNHHHFSYCHLQTPKARFNSLFIRPEGFFDKLTAMVGFDDIDFESAEFSKKFYVKSPDRKFAYDVISQGMMEFLLAHPKHSVWLDDAGLLVVAGGGTWDPEQFPAQADFAVEFLGKIPEYVWEAYRP